ncbi:MAG TPA: hypothetical protein PKK05_17395 [Leptospiraceae bacterium]|nr:hypothetical protein [Leptospiraceae bacterium]
MKKFSHYEYGLPVYKAGIDGVDKEILDLEKSGVDLSDILVNVNENGEWCWGEPTAMQYDDMIAVCDECGMSGNGMITADDYVYKYGRINPKNSSEYVQSGKTYQIDSDGIIR